MNRFAYRTTGLAIRTITALSKATIRIHGKSNIPQGVLIFVANHFTRLETLFLSNHIYRLLDKKPVWSLAAAELYTASLGSFLDAVGALSTHNPDRDRLIVKSLLTGETAWIIYPEGRMVKNKKIFDKGNYAIFHSGEKESPHTGAAALALRTEFYRQRLKWASQHHQPEQERLMDLFQIEAIDSILDLETYIVPVNLTYYPIRAKENLLNFLADHFVERLSDRLVEELMTEGTMLFSGVEIDIRIGPPIQIAPLLDQPVIARDISHKREIDFDEVLPSTPAMRVIAQNVMNRFMSSIYQMTTLNPEHLLACVLKFLRRKHFDLEDLKRRIFLAALAIRSDPNVHYHIDLKQPPVHLLVDDRMGWVAEFIQLALETAVVKNENDRYWKDQAKLTTLFDFHRVRVDNPITVMVNEIEPMTKLQRRLRKIARLPRFRVKRQTVQQLERIALEEFEHDYRTFAIEKESKSKGVGRPFRLRGRSRKKGIVLIHGYMAAPMEVRQLARYLNNCGWWVYALRVKGHGTSPEDLSLRSHEDWIKSVDLGYALISQLCRCTIVGGFSKGGGLALEIAARVPQIRAVFAICPPFKLHAVSARLAPAMDMFNRLIGRVRPQMAVQFVENHPENPEINYSRNPVSGVKELERLMEKVMESCADIHQPTLLAAADGDPVVDEKGVRRFFEKLAAKDKEYRLFHFDRHGIIRGTNAVNVHRAIAEFVRNV